VKCISHPVGSGEVTLSSTLASVLVDVVVSGVSITTAAAESMLDTAAVSVSGLFP